MKILAGFPKLLFTFSCSIIFLLPAFTGFAEDGYRLWLRYDRIRDAKVLSGYRAVISSWRVDGESPTFSLIREELSAGLGGLLLLGNAREGAQNGNMVICGTPSSSSFIAGLRLQGIPRDGEGFLLTRIATGGREIIVITAQKDIGVYYGVFHLLRLLQQNRSLENLLVASSPKIRLRVLNHWDNLDRTVERGYAGASIWNWHTLPDYIDPRYRDYARANASIGINGTVLTNVNANAVILTPQYLAKVAALADVFRPYGIRVYLTARFSAPMEIGNLQTADPLDKEVQRWWNEKAKEVYRHIPDFGGFVVKANSEGQPGPQNYGRSHADGANMLADAVAPHGGVVMWRAFVYDDKNKDDRAKQAYTEFTPLDGSFRSNVLIQVKNGAIDFQPREPFHPLFGAMPKTPLMTEFQITQEYLGFATHLVFLAPLFKECLESDTYAKSPGTTVASVVDGSAYTRSLSGMAGVANIGSDRNWCGHPFAQANWFAYGRLAWDHQLSTDQLAEEWIRLTFGNKKEMVSALQKVMLSSREATVNYMTPLGLHHIMGWNHHYGPGPWIKDKPRADWTSVYYHQADSAGIGFDRTKTGSDAVGQYNPEVRQIFSLPATCPDKYLLWFHHLPWDNKLKSGETLWNGLCKKYQEGVDAVRWMQQTWNEMKPFVDRERFEQVSTFLHIQEQEAVWWRDACLLYFQTFSRRPLPEGVEKPAKSLDYYMSLEFPFAPGIKPKW